MKTATIEKIKAQIIYSFETAEQCVVDVVFHGMPSEAELLRRALTIVDTTELRKISVCFDITEEQCPAWLLESNGKYYFGVE